MLTNRKSAVSYWAAAATLDTDIDIRPWTFWLVYCYSAHMQLFEFRERLDAELIYQTSTISTFTPTPTIALPL